VGGTDLSTSSAAGPWKSETAWADSGGGISPNKFAIPSWQATTASACSACSKSYRNAPDVSANANFTFYVCADQKACTANLYGGTSFAAPMWAGYLALANQQSVANGTGLLGFINPTLYSIGESGTYTTDFHDITSGSNGYSATSGYDLATGWGSPNGAALINALSGPVTPGFSLSASPASVSVVRGNAGSSTITSAVAGGFGGAITLSASGQPTGVTVGFGTNPINGAGSSSMSITVGSSVAAGTYPITVTGTSGSIIETTTVNLTVTAAGATFTLTASPTSISAGRNGSASSTITATVSGTLGTAITFSGSGQGSGNSVTFSPTSLSASGTTKMTVKVGKKATLGTYTITITGTSGTVSHQVTVTLKVT
jgi:kumamolisin